MWVQFPHSLKKNEKEVDMGRFNNIKISIDSSEYKGDALASGRFYDDGGIEVLSIADNNGNTIDNLSNEERGQAVREVASQIIGKPILKNDMSYRQMMLDDSGRLTVCEYGLDGYSGIYNYRITEIYEREETKKIYEKLKGIFEVS